MMSKNCIDIDVLCVGHACYDFVFMVENHPGRDEKIFANNLIACGGGPAANAAITVSKLGLKSAFAGYLGQDVYGELHHQEFSSHHVDTRHVVRGSAPTPVSTILVKPDGKRSLINYKGSTQPLSVDAIDLSTLKAKAVLFDGHEPHLSLVLVDLANKLGVPTVLDAGSMHEGTSKLWSKVDYLVASEKFALNFADDVQTALMHLAEVSPAVVITMGDKGLIWQRGGKSGSLSAISIKAIDTTGAGDAFHGAFAAALAINMDWLDMLRYASVAGAICCTKIGAREGLPSKEEHDNLYKQFEGS